MLDIKMPAFQVDRNGQYRQPRAQLPPWV